MQFIITASLRSLWSIEHENHDAGQLLQGAGLLLVLAPLWVACSACRGMQSHTPLCEQGDPHENALRNGRNEMEKLEGRLDMSREMSVVDSAHRLYKLALEKNFTRGRRIAHVCTSSAVCSGLTLALIMIITHMRVGHGCHHMTIICSAAAVPTYLSVVDAQACLQHDNCSFILFIFLVQPSIVDITMCGTGGGRLHVHYLPRRPHAVHADRLQRCHPGAHQVCKGSQPVPSHTNANLRCLLMTTNAV